ncbi:MAG: hypothetical protein R3338_01515 [Thermoanaerobaculia bacterium]|nr:hypothetical protein [Thermoanaerobaculia bacterium]
MSTESTTLRAAARIISLGAFYAASQILDQPKIKRAAAKLDRELEKIQGVAEHKADKATDNMTDHKGLVIAGVAALVVAGLLISRAATD